MAFNSSVRWYSATRKHSHSKAVAVQEILQINPPVVMTLSPKKEKNQRSSKIRRYSIANMVTDSEHVLDYDIKGKNCFDRKSFFDRTQIHGCAEIIVPPRNNEKPLKFIVPLKQYCSNTKVYGQYHKQK